MKAERIHVSFVSIHSILGIEGRYKYYRRWVIFQIFYGAIHIESSTKQANLKVKQNPQFKEFHVKNILIDNEQKCCETEIHPYELHLKLNEIKCNQTQTSHIQTHSFIGTFNPKMLDILLRALSQETLYKTIKSK